ncbi:MAG TPA: YidC/Oxa1 family membrane protein insertase, partial [Ardenticatenaceae bacterium]|nr:YidC/Oxa1 family membrane protein insertase [Ardenticatenaceae bacterium]
SKAMQELQPKLKALQEKHKGNRELQTQEMMALYKEHGVNPAGGCLPLLLQLPILFALFSALRGLATQGYLTDRWLWLPSLAEPTSMDIFWPMENWNGDTLAYLVLPILTVITQYVVQKQMAPATSGSKDDPTAAMMNQMNTIMPIMTGFFALQMPSGVSLYWVTGNVFAMFQQTLISGSFTLPRWLGGQTYTLPGYSKTSNPPPLGTIPAKQERPASLNGNSQEAMAQPETADAVSTKEKRNVSTASRKRKKRRS